LDELGALCGHLIEMWSVCDQVIEAAEVCVPNIIPKYDQNVWLARSQLRQRDRWMWGVGSATLALSAVENLEILLGWCNLILRSVVSGRSPRVTHSFHYAGAPYKYLYSGAPYKSPKTAPPVAAAVVLPRARRAHIIKNG
jgi:hypothetical protein